MNEKQLRGTIIVEQGEQACLKSGPDWPAERGTACGAASSSGRTPGGRPPDERPRLPLPPQPEPQHRLYRSAM